MTCSASRIGQGPTSLNAFLGFTCHNYCPRVFVVVAPCIVTLQVCCKVGIACHATYMVFEWCSYSFRERANSAKRKQ